MKTRLFSAIVGAGASLTRPRSLSLVVAAAATTVISASCFGFSRDGLQPVQYDQGRDLTEAQDLTHPTDMTVQASDSGVIPLDLGLPEAPDLK